MKVNFPRTMVGGISLPRLIVGTNWFLGFSHTTKAKDDYIKANVMERKKIADILEVFFRAGCNAVMGLIDRPPLKEAIMEAQDRTGVECIIISTPSFPYNADTPFEGFNRGEAERIVELHKHLGATILMPHQETTDAMVDRCLRQLRRMDELCGLIREYGMIPGLSSHMPEAIVYADESGLDVETYISIYNAMGFLMQVEVDWTASIIRNARKPVMTIKPMAAGQIRPFQALSFVWHTIRDCDMVTVGTMSPDEAAECIELSLSILERRQVAGALQETRSKSSVKHGGDGRISENTQR